MRGEEDSGLRDGGEETLDSYVPPNNLITRISVLENADIGSLKQQYHRIGFFPELDSTTLSSHAVFPPTRSQSEALSPMK